MRNLKEERLGTIHRTNDGNLAKVVEYENGRNVVIEFLNVEFPYKMKSSYKEVSSGRISYPFNRKVYGVGYVGVGRHSTSENINGINSISKCYAVWHGMIRRCYSEKRNSRNEMYNNVTVCEEWHNFQNFAEWYHSNKYCIEGQKMCLDKDILNKGNKVYSPSTCIIVPLCINILFVKHDKARGIYPIGVHFSKGKFQSRCKNQITNKRIYIGTYNTAELAFKAYKEYKEAHIKEVADYYKKYIPKELYDAMYRYEVEITD